MRILIISLLIFISAASFGQASLTKSKIKLLKGTWISEQDKNWIWVFYDSTVVNIYQHQKEKPSKYTILKDTLLLKDPGIEGLLKYEVLGLTDKRLSVMYLDNGKIFIFKRKR